jgi:hypothetical protein
MRESTSAPQSILQRITRYNVPIIAAVLVLFAFHWRALHDDESALADRTDVRAQTIADTAALALREPLLSKNVPAIMILVESLVRENHDVLAATVGGKDGRPLAETESEHIDVADVRSERTLREPVLVHDADGSSKAIGTIELRVSRREAEELASANTQIIAIEGGVCLLLCAGIIVISRKRTSSTSSSTAARAGTARAPTAVSSSVAATASIARDKSSRSSLEPRAPLPANDRASDEEAVEVALNAPPPRDEKSSTPVEPGASGVK